MRSNSRIIQICRAGLFSALLSLGAWVTIPFPVPITMQTFVLFLMAGTLPLSESILSVVIYLCLGFAGLPVFAGFSGGIGTILGPTGGFILGFLPFVLIHGFLSKKNGLYILSAVVSLILLYVCGCVWYTYIYGGKGIIGACVLPFLPADAIKLVISLPLSSRLRRHIR